MAQAHDHPTNHDQGAHDMTTRLEIENGRALGKADTWMECGECGLSFDVPKAWYLARKNDHATFFCPNGHQRWFPPDETAEARLRRDLKTARHSEDFYRERAAAERRSHAATKGQLTKTKNRIASGVCPCCNRSFVDLGRHMAGQHPDYTRR